MTEVDTSADVVDTTAAPYSEDNPDHLPDPTAVYGTLDTSGTAGGHHEKLEMISPIFDVAKAKDAQWAARAIDPEDDEVSEGTHVVLPGDGRDADAGREAIRAAAARFADDKVAVADPSVKAAEAEAGRKEDEGSGAGSGEDTTQTQTDEAQVPNEGAQRTRQRVEGQQRGTSATG